MFNIIALKSSDEWRNQASFHLNKTSDLASVRQRTDAMRQEG
ncbi:hypothetical protein [Marinomonas polaris]